MTTPHFNNGDGGGDVPDTTMLFVITKPSGHVLGVGQAAGKTLKGIKGNVTKTLAKRGYFKNKRKGHNGEWLVSKESPFWILRGRDVNYYRGKMGFLVCVYLIPDHLIDHLDPLYSKGDGGNRS